MGKNRRNHENTNQIVKENHKELMCFKEEMKELKSMVSTVVHQVQKSTFKNVMNGPDLSEFFPVTKESQLLEFMDRQHPEWPARRDEFAFYLFNCVTDSKKTFTKGLLNRLFTREYMRTVKWPNSRSEYVSRVLGLFWGFVFANNAIFFSDRTTKPSFYHHSFISSKLHCLKWSVITT